MKYLLTLILISGSLYAEVLKKTTDGDFVLTKNTISASELITDYARLMGYNMNISTYVKDESFEVQGEMLIPKDQIESYVSSILMAAGSAMIRAKDSRFLQVIDARDIRFTTVPTYTKLEDIPENVNYAQYSFVLKYIESSDLARNMRPFMSRYGRIIDVRDHMVYIIDNGKNLRRIGKIAQALDTEEFLKSKKEIDSINEKYKQSKVKSKTFYEILTQNQTIFILIFFLMGSIIGFGTRSFVMKKVEGGW